MDSLILVIGFLLSCGLWAALTAVLGASMFTDALAGMLGGLGTVWGLYRI